MIVSASRRTDVPAFFGEWFRRRLDAGFCLVSNPFNPRQVTRVSLQPEGVDAFVFWTRNSRPFVPVIEELETARFNSVFLVTLTGYGPPLEPGSPPPRDAVDSMRDLAQRIGPERITWRYDPIVLGPGLGPEEHRRRFAELAAALDGATARVVTSFVDLYRKTTRRLSALPDGAAWLNDPALHPEAASLLGALADIAGEHGMSLRTCAEHGDHSAVGVSPGACIDATWLEQLFGRRFPHSKDRGQRPHCRCAPARDIGVPDTCLHGCRYCYATISHWAAVRNHARHDPGTPSLLPPAGRRTR